jgi:hypothetical protein
MARKLYIFVPTGRVKTNGISTKWIGGFVTMHAFLGDQDARLLGMGDQYALKRLPVWLHTPTGGAKNLKGGASRHDRDFGGWG